MKVIVGLGNPGKKFEKTRHNVGFLVINELLKTEQLIVNKKKEKYKTEIFETEINNAKVILAKPQAFMNSSGVAVKKLFTVYCPLFTDLFVIHDDIDLPIGKIRISAGRGAAGHKGVESIIKELGVKSFVRIRIGVQPKTGKPKKVEKFVLQKFSKEEEKNLKQAIGKTIEAIEMAINEGMEKAMSEYNK